MGTKDSTKSIWKQPLGEVMRKEIPVPDILTKDLRDLPVGEFLRKEIRLRKKTPGIDEEVEQVKCVSCGRYTPATVSTCLHCGAHHEVEYDMSRDSEQIYVIDTPDTEADEMDSIPLIDSWGE